MAIKALSKLEIGEGNVAPKSRIAETGAMASFGAAFRGKSWQFVKVSMLTLVFALPAIAWYIVNIYVKAGDAAFVPYSANIGIGLDATTNAYEIGARNAFEFDFRCWLIMIPLIMLLSIGLSGAFYVMKRHVCGEGAPTIKGFFRGIKRCILPFLVCSVPMSLSVFALAYTVIAFPVYTNLHIALRIAFIALAAILLLFASSFSLFYVTLSLSYKMGVGARISNAFMLTFCLMPRSLVIFAICGGLLSLLFLQLGFLTALVVMLFMFFGIAFLVCICSVYTQWAFDKYINVRLREEERTRNRAVKLEKKLQRRAERLAGSGKDEGRD